MAEPTTIKELDLTYYLDVALRRRWIVAAVAVIVFVLTALVTFMARPVYQASSMLVIEKERGGAAQSTAMVENSNEDYYQTQYKLLQSRSLLEKVYADLKLGDQPDFANPRGVEKLQEAIVIAPIYRSRLVNVRVNSFDPTLAAAIANRLSDLYVDQNLANQLFISKEVLQALQAKGGDTNAADLPSVVNSALIQSLKAEYAKLQTSYAGLYARYTDKHPTVIRVKSSMVALDSQIRAETARIVASMKTELSGQLRGNNVRVVDPAIVPDRPIKPNKPKNVLLGLVAGVVLGFACAMLVELLDQSVRTQDDVATRLGQPFLGVVPQAVVKAGRIYEALLSHEVSLTSESFRNLRTMVDFAGVGGKAQALLVTSAIQGEGKTYIAANMAIAYAQLGESILLIDGDLRRPNVHRVFGLSAEKGLSDYLVSGKKAEDAAQLIQKSAVPGLSILTCGPRPPNPSELLNTPRLGALISWGREHYDRVIVDCVPMFPINDTLLWGRHIASVALVCRYGETRVPLIIDACQKLKSANLQILGVVLNAAKSGGLSYSAYNYYYYEQYYQEAAEKPELTKAA